MIMMMIMMIKIQDHVNDDDNDDDNVDYDDSNATAHTLITVFSPCQDRVLQLLHLLCIRENQTQPEM